MTRLISLVASNSGSEMYLTVNIGVDVNTRVAVFCVVGCLADFKFAIGGRVLMEIYIFLDNPEITWCSCR